MSFLYKMNTATQNCVMRACKSTIKPAVPARSDGSELECKSPVLPKHFPFEDLWRLHGLEHLRGREKIEGPTCWLRVGRDSIAHLTVHTVHHAHAFVERTNG